MTSHSHEHCHHHHASPAPDQGVASRAPAPEAQGQTSMFGIEDMDCPTEETLIRNRLAAMPEVKWLGFDLLRRRLTVIHAENTRPAIEAALQELDFTPVNLDGGEPGPSPESRGRGRWPRVLAALALALAAELSGMWLSEQAWPVALISLAAIVLAGFSTFRKAGVALRQFTLNINVLMAIAVTGALAIGQWPEAAMVMALFALAEALEARALGRARQAIASLLELAPDEAEVRAPDGSWVKVPASEVPLAAIVRIKPGERIPLDGEVCAGRSAVNQAPITGESLPVDKQPGDPVFAGTINANGLLTIRVTVVAAQSTLARIVRAVERAQAEKAPAQRFVDGFARLYTPTVFVLAVLTALLPPLFGGAPFTLWLYRALVLLVIACPCALVISTPVTLVSGLTAGARHGILVKGGGVLEQGAGLKTLALDKTGTLTTGKPVVTGFLTLTGEPEAELLRLAASLAAQSTHPVSQAVVAYRQARGDERPLLPVSGAEALPGRGVRGCVGGEDYRLGNHRLIEESGWCSPAIEARLFPLEEGGETAVVLARGGEVIAMMAVADSIREHSVEAVRRLHRLGLRTLLLSGDNAHATAAVARAVSIDDARGDQLPEDKAAALTAAADQGGGVGMVGDGINDAPALARAHVGFAMGAAGSATAIETADVALMDDDVRKLADFVVLSRRTVAVLRQNIALALAIKLVFLGLALAGQATLWMAVFADMGASLLVIANGLRLLRLFQGRGVDPRGGDA